MREWITILGEPIVDSGLAASIITGLLALMMLSTRQPSRRRALARAGVLGALLAIPIVCLRPYAPVDIAEPLRRSFGPAQAWIGSLLDVIPYHPIAARLQLPPGLARRVASVLLVGYLVGVSVGLARFALASWVSGWVGRNSDPASEASLALYETIPHLGGRRRPRLRVSSRVRSPVLLGTFRPTILIPPEFERSGSTESLRLGLLHELAHSEASDPLFTLASELAAIFWFPLPPLWWIRKQMRRDQEFLADRRASERFGASSRYASSLVEIAATPAPERHTKRTVSGTDLFQRVLMLVRCPFPIEVRPPRWWRSALIGATTLLVLVATGMTLRVKSSSATTEPCREPRLFTMAVLVLGESPMAPAPTSLPIRLPATFDLSFQVYATSAELPQISVLGHSIARAGLPEDTMIREPNRWHRVKVRRESGWIYLALDDQPMTLLAGKSLDNWLTIRPVLGRRTTFRSIRVEW
jgi:beta-lactamase regulating signal transducer with metallopeptidase domain